MAWSTAEKQKQLSIWLSVLIHILLLLALIYFIAKNKEEQEKQQKPAQNFVPAYTYTGSIKPKIQKTAPPQKMEQKQQAQPEASQEKPQEQPLTTERYMKKTVTTTTKQHRPTSLLAASFSMLKEQQLQEVSEPADDEPIYLIGDDSMPADPLIKLLGRSLSAHFKYPETAGRLGIKGKVLVELTLHPNGNYSHIRMVKSSQNQDLDAAALYAANTAPRIEGADRFLSKPKHFVIGFVFY